MIVSILRRDTRFRRLTPTLYAYTFLDDLVLLYPLYALLFLDAGLSVVEISSLLAIWSVVSAVLEVPSGALADAMSRRALLVAAPLARIAGFALWLGFPSYLGFALGFALWGVQGALRSGALEALAYEELDRSGQAARYPAVLGRARAAGTVAVVAATAAAGPVFALAGHPGVGVASLLAGGLTAAVGAALPEHRTRADRSGSGRIDAGAGGAGGAGWLTLLRAALTEVRQHRPVRYAVVLVATVTAIWGSLEEYVPLLARETGVPAAAVPVVALLIWAGITTGGLLAGTRAAERKSALPVLLAGGGLVLLAGAVVRQPAGLLLVAVAFGALQLADVLTDARLQSRITGPSRATVTSLAGAGSALATVAIYGGYAAVAEPAGHGTAFAVSAVPYLVIAVGLVSTARQRTPAPSAERTAEPEPLRPEPTDQR